MSMPSKPGCVVLELRLTPRAEADLEDIWRYSSGEWGPEQADHYVDALAETFRALCETPGMARERLELSPPARVHPTGRHVVVYLVEGETLMVVRVLGGRQDWAAVLSKVDG